MTKGRNHPSRVNPFTKGKGLLRLINNKSEALAKLEPSSRYVKQTVPEPIVHAEALEVKDNNEMGRRSVQLVPGSGWLPIPQQKMLNTRVDTKARKKDALGS